MSKYDFSLDLTDTTSTGLILKKIKKESTILEFGCATGRMTKYMKENLDCKVYIVEYERDAYDVAAHFAVDGVCDDILKFTWVTQFKNIKFDAIIFADVLEHLSRPEDVLKQCKNLLADDGKIYISIPNITHNDVLLNAINDEFNYTKVGLLDDTHIHFWGLKNLYKLAENNGLYVEKIEATYCSTGMSEQAPKIDYEDKENLFLLNALKKRSCGEVYQFVMVLGRENVPGTVNIKNPFVTSHIYLDKGEGFNSEDVLAIPASYIGNDEFQIDFVMENMSGVRAFRIDPIEQQNCIITACKVNQTGQELQFVYSENIYVNEGVLLLSEDPMITIPLLCDAGSVKMHVKFVLAGKRFLNDIQKTCIENMNEREKLVVRKNELEVRKNELENCVQIMQEEKKKIVLEQNKLKNNIEDLKRENETILLKQNELLRNVEQFESERSILQSRINEYIMLVNKKDESMIQKENELNYYKNLYSVRVVTGFAHAKRKVKSALRKWVKKVE